MPAPPAPAARWPVHVINMAANVTRLDHAARSLARAGIAFERFEAVDGRALEEAEVARVYDAKANRRRFRHPLIRPEIGCYLSHVALWRRIAASPAPGAVILEDDLAAAPDLAAVLDALAADTGAWDIVKLYARNPRLAVHGRRPLAPGRDIAIPRRVPSTTLGYVIRREAAARLLETSLPFSRPIDEDHKFVWEHGLAIAVVVPPPLSTGVEAAETGTIHDARRAATRPRVQGLAGRGWRSLRYRLGFLLGLWRHRLRGN